MRLELARHALLNASSDQDEGVAGPNNERGTYLLPGLLQKGGAPGYRVRRTD